MFWQNSANPCGTVSLLKVAASGQWSAAVKHTDVIQAKKAAFKKVLAEPVFAVHPPAEVQHQLRKGALEKVDVALAAQGLFRPV